MTKNPYSSAEIDCGTVRDVKNFICAALDMHGLCDDDYGMELLVAGRIVVGAGGYCSPPRRMPFDSTNEGLKRVSTTSRAMRLAYIAHHVIGCH